jgi:hypothetical protein
VKCGGGGAVELRVAVRGRAARGGGGVDGERSRCHRARRATGEGTVVGRSGGVAAPASCGDAAAGGGGARILLKKRIK